MLKDRKLPDERKIEAIIQKGGSASGSTENGEETQNVQLRLQPNLLSRIDAIRNRDPKEIRQSRHAWMVKAILDRLKAEE